MWTGERLRSDCGRKLGTLRLSGSKNRLRPAMVLSILKRNVSEKRAFELLTRGGEISAQEAKKLDWLTRYSTVNRLTMI